MAKGGTFNFHPEYYTRKLAIIVPYRDRLDHLKRFMPHISAYFERDKLDRYISVSFNVIEQFGDKPFNRGKIKNCGFALVKDVSDYVCFHDVDYLPIWADYSWSRIPARLIWFGLTLREDWNNFFGGVTLFDNSAFLAVNGYPNCYWGWGREDFELGRRCHIKGFGFEKRDGTYSALPHKHAGFQAPGFRTKEARRTHDMFGQRESRLEQLIDEDGLTNLQYKLIEKREVRVEGEVTPNAWHFLVDIG
jgi:hypothetical protein